MRVLLTGGSGFIGRNFVELLGRKHEISAPTHRELDLADAEAVDAYFRDRRFDVVVHSAVRPGHRAAADRSGQLYLNTRMFFALVKNSDRWGRMIVLSSGCAYDERHYRPKMREEYFGTHIPVDEAGLSKYAVGKYIERADDIVDLRPFSVFGKYEDYSIRFISNVICKTLFDLPVTIKQNRRFDFIAVEDVVAVVDHFIEHAPREKAYNLSPDRAVELVDVARRVLAHAGKQLEIVVKQEGMALEYSGDNARVKSEIPGLRLTPLDESIARLYDWYAGRMDRIDRNELLFDK
jgi:GDP-L-fucose synthase